MDSRQLLNQIEDRLSRHGYPKNEAKEILSRAFERLTSRKINYIDISSIQVTQSLTILTEAWVQLRIQGLPLQYLTGVQEFNGQDYVVNASVLVPRQETEILILTAIHEIKKNFSDTAPLIAFELGFGSGILTIELLRTFKSMQIYSADVSLGAIKVFNENKAKLLTQDQQKQNIAWLQSKNDIFENLKQHLNKQSLGVPLDIIISNPPYLDATKNETTEEVLSYEPPEALWGPAENVLYFYQKLILEGYELLNQGGMMFLEIPHERSDQIQQIYCQKPWKSSQLIQDFNQRDRVLILKK